MELKAIDINGTPYFLNNIFDMIYPVGSVYISVNTTSPASLFGGTWTKIKGRFLYACEDSGITSGLTGGAKSVSYTPAGTNSGGAVSNHTLTVDQIPSHNHSFTGSEVSTGNQSAGHTHYVTDYYATTTALQSLSVAQLASHKHNLYGANNGYSYTATNIGNDWAQFTTGWSTDTWIANTGSSNAHSHNGANTSATRTTTGISANHTHKVTASGSIGNKGGGKAHNHGFTQPTFKGTAATIATMPPYLAVNVWKRIT